MKTANAIEVRGLSVSVADHEIVRDVSFSLLRGQWLGMVGPNGAGKSTIMRAVAGLMAHTGEVLLEGHPIDRMSSRELARLVAVVPQNPNVPEAMTVSEYVLIGRTPHLSYLGKEDSADRQQTTDTLQRMDLSAFNDREMGSLSGGERQRAVIARALNQGAPILLLDEPTSALDVGHQQEVLDMVDHLRREDGLAVISAMHDLSHAGQYPDQVMLLRSGRVMATGPAEDVLTADAILDHYGASVRIMAEPTGGVSVVPSRTARRTPVILHERPDGTVEALPPVKPPVRARHGEVRSLLIVNTGYGKGKSTAAFGMLMRAAARNWDVIVIQFIKSGTWKVGEEKIARALGVEWWSLGDGFTWDSKDLDETQAAAVEAWAAAKAAIESGKHDFVLLDELTYPISWGWIPEEEVLSTLRDRPPHVNVVVTGRDATDGLIDIADTATEMAKIKHAYDSGIPARRGIDF